jgi:autotransporter-associated beta strand protein
MASVTNFTFDTGSTGIQIPTSKFCAIAKNNPNCAKDGKVKTTNNPNFLGYAQITLSSSGEKATGKMVVTPITIYDASNNQMAAATVPVLVADGAPCQGGVGFGRPETDNGLQLYSDEKLTTPKTGPNGKVYGRALNPLLNLTSLSGQTPPSATLAPGYTVTQTAVYLGLGGSSISTQNGSQLTGAVVSLTALPQPPAGATLTFATSSTYATNATQSDWQTPPMLMQISDNNPSSTPSLNGYFYGSAVVDTGLAVGIISNGTNCTIAGATTGCVNQALVQSAVHSATPTSIAISLGGAGGSGNPPAQFKYVFQGVCKNSDGSTTGCGPSGTKYDGTATVKGVGTLQIGNQSCMMIPMYPTSGSDSLNNGYDGTNTGFSDTTAQAAFLNTGVNFLNYFNIVYDPVNGFIGYVPKKDASAPPGTVSVTSVLALQGTQPAGQPPQIPGGTVPWPIYLFTAIGNQNSQNLAPVDVVLSVASGSTATFSGAISSDTICTNTNCSPGLSTGLVLNSGTLVLGGQNTYTGLTTVQSGATLTVNGSIASSLGLTIEPGGTVNGTGTLPTKRSPHDFTATGSATSLFKTPAVELGCGSWGPTQQLGPRSG